MLVFPKGIVLIKLLAKNWMKDLTKDNYLKMDYLVLTMA